MPDNPEPRPRVSLAEYLGPRGAVDRLIQLRDHLSNAMGPVGLATLDEGIARIRELEAAALAREGVIEAARAARRKFDGPLEHYLRNGGERFGLPDAAAPICEILRQVDALPGGSEREVAMGSEQP